MSSSAIFTGALMLALGGSVFVAACSGDADSVHYGPPSGLTGKVPTQMPSDGGTGGNNGGNNNGGNDAGSGGNGVCGGNGPAGTGTCAVSWSKDIYPLMQPTGAWRCADTGACHGAGVPPAIDPAVAATAYKQLTDYKQASNGNKPYINPCSIDPAASSIVCNTKSSGGCGAAMPLGAPLTADASQKLATWVGCGSPEN